MSVKRSSSQVTNKEDIEFLLNIDEDVEKIEADFREMIAFWKKIYLRKKG